MDNVVDGKPNLSVRSVHVYAARVSHLSHASHVVSLYISTRVAIRYSRVAVCKRASREGTRVKRHGGSLWRGEST